MKLTINVVNQKATGWMVRRTPDGDVWHLMSLGDVALCCRFIPTDQDEYQEGQTPDMVFCSFCLKMAQVRA